MRRRDLLWLLPLLLLLSSPLWQKPLGHLLRPRGGFNPIVMQPNQDSPIHNFNMEAVSLTLSSAGEEEWRIDADQAFTGDQDSSIEMNGVKAMYIGRKREPINIHSKQGRYLINERELILMGQVLLRKPLQREELRTELLHYYDASKMAISPGKVKIDSPKLRLQAGSMRYNLSNRAYDFGQPVRIKL